jgi:hypothetical protein
MLLKKMLARAARLQLIADFFDVYMKAFFVFHHLWGVPNNYLVYISL